VEPSLWLVLGLVATGLASLAALGYHAIRFCSRSRLEETLKRKGRSADLDRFFRREAELLQTLRLLQVLASVAATVLVARWAVDRFGSTGPGWLMGAAVAAGLLLGVGEAVPSAWAAYAAEALLAPTLGLWLALATLLAPLRAALGPLGVLVRRLAGVPKGAEPRVDIEDRIVSAADAGERQGALEEDQKDMIANVIKLRRTDASQIMTPRTDIVSIEADASLDQARRLIAASGFSRIPVTRGGLDAIVGVLYAKDLLDPAKGGPLDGGLTVGQVMRKPLFVPETKRLDELLREFQTNKVHLAIVLDEYGGTAGLVTIEDVVEEIVGEIADEHEPEPTQTIRRLGERAFEVEARLRVDELNEALGLRLPEDEDYETVGGFVLSRLGYIPKPGESITHEGAVLTVTEADERRILRLRIDLPPTAEPAEDRA